MSEDVIEPKKPVTRKRATATTPVKTAEPKKPAPRKRTASTTAAGVIDPKKPATRRRAPASTSTKATEPKKPVTRKPAAAKAPAKSADVIEFPKKSGPGVGHRTRKRADATTTVTADDFNSDDEVKNFEALKLRLSQMLARRDISERDFKAISVEYRTVMVELKEARDRAEAKKLGQRRGLTAVGGRSFDGDI